VICAAIGLNDPGDGRRWGRRNAHRSGRRRHCKDITSHALDGAADVFWLGRWRGVCPPDAWSETAAQSKAEGLSHACAIRLRNTRIGFACSSLTRRAPRVSRVTTASRPRCPRAVRRAVARSCTAKTSVPPSASASVYVIVISPRIAGSVVSNSTTSTTCSFVKRWHVLVGAILSAVSMAVTGDVAGVQRSDQALGAQYPRLERQGRHASCCGAAKPSTKGEPQCSRSKASHSPLQSPSPPPQPAGRAPIPCRPAQTSPRPGGLPDERRNQRSRDRQPAQCRFPEPRDPSAFDERRDRRWRGGQPAQRRLQSSVAPRHWATKDEINAAESGSPDSVDNK